MENIKDGGTSCIIAHSDVGNFDGLKYCRMCLIPDITNCLMKLNEVSLLLRIEDVHLKAKLSSCITNSNRLACDRFQFIPNEICDYEAFNSYGAEHSKEMKLNAMFKILESGSYSTRARCTDNTDSGCQRKDIETNDHSLIRPEEEGDRSHDTSSGIWLSTVIVKYDGGSDCLACLLLLHEVLLVSLSNSNVCMIEKKEGLECACKTTLTHVEQTEKA